MKDNREKILSEIRHALGRSKLSRDTENVLIEKMHTRRREILPKINKNPLDQFIEKASAALTKIKRIASIGDAPYLIKEMINPLPNHLKVARDIPISWAKFPELNTQTGPAEDEDEISVTLGLCGIAETGTIVLVSSHDSPTTLNFLPKIHIILLSINQLVLHYEEAFAMIREKNLDPRVINFITGPSRTADIEQTLLIGMHGPKELYVFLYD